jgi:hypothetical protein
MQTIEDFMREYFHARLAEEERYLASRAPYRQRFFTGDCQWDNRARSLEIIKSEQIEGVNQGDTETLVITAYKIAWRADDPKRHRLRYHLKPEGHSWLIRYVELACPLCQGLGGSDCMYCKGKQWVTNQE